MKRITLYTTPTCVFCPAIKKILDAENVTYEEIDVSDNAEALDHMKNVSGQMGVPVTVIDDEVVIGFNKKKLKKALEA